MLIAEEKVSVLVVRCTSRHPHPSSLNRDNTWHLAGHCSTAALQWDYSLIVAAALHTADCSRGQLAVQCQYQYNWVLGYICAKLQLSFIHEASRSNILATMAGIGSFSLLHIMGPTRRRSLVCGVWTVRISASKSSIRTLSKGL